MANLFTPIPGTAAPANPQAPPAALMMLAA